MAIVWRVVLVLSALTTICLGYPNFRYADDVDVLQALAEVKRGGLPYYGERDPAYLQYYSQLYSSAFPKAFPDGYTGQNGARLLNVDPTWPSVSGLSIGQVGGLAIDKDNHIHVFHRGDNDFTTYNEPTEEQDLSEGAIQEATLLELDPQDGSVLFSWGHNFSYVPHGLTIDHEGFFWITDVTRNQVIKLRKGDETPLLTIGEEFVPADDNFDHDRLCKPTDVAISKNNDIFVADGYCNSRIVRYTQDGEYVGQIGTDELNIPHSLALIEHLDLICVADRETKRIACYGAGLKNKDDFGVLRSQVTHEILGKVYAIDYSPTDNLLYAVTMSSAPGESKGYIIDVNDGVDLLFNERPFTPLDTPKGYNPPENEEFDQITFVAPHDLAVSPDGTFLVIGEIRHRGQKNLWKFDRITKNEGESEQPAVPVELPEQKMEESIQDDIDANGLEQKSLYYGRP